MSFDQRNQQVENQYNAAGDIHIHPPRLNARDKRNRQRMLQKVHDFWIKGVLESSLHGATLIELGLEYEPDAVQHPWDMVIQQPDQPIRSIPPGTKIIDVFDELREELLILGAPGSGKTTMLLELARDLIERAEQDESYPIPVVFNLSSWAEKRKPLVEWLVDELNSKYDVPRKIGWRWLEADQVLPLLDGLDEVKSESREACVQVINIYRRDHGLANIIVCSRIEDYNSLTTRLKLQAAVVVTALTLQQIDKYLVSVGDQFVHLRVILTQNNLFRELAETPLMLSMMMLVYRDTMTDNWLLDTTIEEQRKQLFKLYVERMFARRSLIIQYSPEQTIRQLSWLAKRMSELSHSVFFIERLQSDWLASHTNKLWYVLVDRFCGAMVLGVVINLIMISIYGIQDDTTLSAFAMIKAIFVTLIYYVPLVALFGGERNVPFGLWCGITQGLRRAILGGLVVGLFGTLAFAPFQGLIATASISLGSVTTGGIIGALAGGPSVRPRNIVVVEAIHWSWSKAIRSAAGGLGVGLGAGRAAGLIVGIGGVEMLGIDRQVMGALNGNLMIGLAVALAFTISNGLLATFFLGLLGGLIGNELEIKAVPNQGIWRSARSAVIGAIAGTIIFGIFGSLGYETINFASAVTGGVIGMLAYGGYACISHFTLRLILWRNSYIPWNYARFLDYCAERIFLRKVGGGYIFIHRMLMEYFAELDTSQLEKSSTAKARSE